MRTLEQLISIVKSRILPYKKRVKQGDYHAFEMALGFATDTNQVEALYTTWQGKLRLKNIADLPDLPDLHAKPKPVRTRYDKAA